MRGAIAAGHPVTAEAGARVLAEGGNAVDACVAAGIASWVTESTLTGPGGGGFILVHRASDRSDRLLDFFVSVPGLGEPPRPTAPMETVSVGYPPDTSVQLFRIGASTCAVPGASAGLEAAQRAYGTLPWREVVAPAIELAREGVELNAAQAYLHEVLDCILSHTAEGRALFARDGRPLVVGERLVNPDLAVTLEQIAEEGAAAIYRGELAERIVDYVREHGGAFTRRDLEDYRVIRRRPVRATAFGHEFVSNPPPSTGGLLIAYGLRLLELLGPPERSGSAEEMALLADVMREQARARREEVARDLYRGGLVRRLLSDDLLAAARERIESLQPSSAREAAGSPSTTQVSVVDASGNAASMTATTGTGSGVVVPGTGFQLNNMLGEFDVAVTGSPPRPGMRFTSGMAPSIVLKDGRPRLVVGSAGSLRLRGAIMQIVLNCLVHGMPVGEAIERPRVHWDEPQLHCEGGCDPAEVDRLASWGYDVLRWMHKNLYFGGAAAVELLADGSLAAAGDSRRGGHGIVVPREDPA